MLNRIKEIVNQILNDHNYFKIDDLQDWGYCGICGSPMKEIFPKVWAWGICKKCIDSCNDKK